MAVATSTLVALGLAAAAAGTNYYNTKNTERKQDNALADSIRNRSNEQRNADARVNEEVQKMQGSNSAGAKAQALQGYMDQLTRNRRAVDAGFNNTIGSAAFGQDQATALQGVNAHAANNANLMARIDAPTMQRQNEGFGFGKLATDLGLLGRQTQGNAYLDDLRLRNIRRNAGLDLASSLMGAAAGGIGSGGAGGFGAAGVSQTSFDPLPAWQVTPSAVPYMPMKQPQFYGGG